MEGKRNKKRKGGRREMTLQAGAKEGIGKRDKWLEEGERKNRGKEE